MKRLSALFNVNTFFVSQVNPHVCPFVSVDNVEVMDTKLRRKVSRSIKALIGNQIRHIYK